MTGQDLVAELIQCYIPPPPKMQERMAVLADTIPEESRQPVLDAILETVAASTKISESHIIEACNLLQVSYTKAHFTPALSWQCDCCMYNFRYTPAPSDDEKLDKSLFDVCPMCGFQPGWTILRDQYKAMGRPTLWYDRLMTNLKGGYGPGIPKPQGTEGKQTRGGLFWERSKAEQERRDKLRMAVNDKIAKIDQAKHWEGA